MKKVVLFKSESEEYQKAFKESNYETLFVEPLQFEYMNSEHLSEKLVQAHYEGLIVTSPRAVEAVAKCWDPTKFIIWNTKRVYTIGEMTSHRIKLSLGLEALGQTSGNAENLAKIILNDCKGLNDNSKQLHFLFPCGNLRAETLPSTLGAGGISVDALTVYETKENINLKTELMKLSDHSPCCLVFFSPSGCEYIHRQLQTFSNELSHLPHFAIGNSTAHKIENLGLEIAGVADKPQADRLVESVQQYFTTSESAAH